MQPIPIGEAAARLGMSVSALRYYDGRGLASPADRVHGQRVYGLAEMRRLALLKLARELGLPLDAAVAVLDAPAEQRRATARQQLADLEQLINRARSAQSFLAEALQCPADHPANECSNMVAALDRLLAGGQIDELANGS